MTSLHEIQGFNKYCGPAVLAAITGKSTDYCASVISSVTGKNVIKGVQHNDLLTAIDMLGFVAHAQKLINSSVYGFMVANIRKPGFYILRVPHHVIALEITDDAKIYLIDNHTKHSINASSSARLSQAVENAWLIVKKPEPSKQDLANNRIKFLSNEIKIINSRIESLMQTKMRYLQELDQLENEMKND